MQKASATVDVSDAMLSLGARQGTPQDCARALTVALARLVSHGAADCEEMVRLLRELGRPVRRVEH